MWVDLRYRRKNGKGDVKTNLVYAKRGISNALALEGMKEGMMNLENRNGNPTTSPG
jgi:hypothetical protein